MRVRLQDKRIVRLKHFRLVHPHYILLCGLQQEVPNMLLEIEPISPGGKREFVPIHAIDLDRFQELTLLNLPGD
jgi:hypothetical protein